MRNNTSNGDARPGESLTPSELCQPESEHVQSLLEQLDDVIFSAIMGDTEALASASRLWSEVVRTLGWELVEESREQYLRYAVDVAKRLDREDIRTAESSLAALEIISLLTKH